MNKETIEFDINLYSRQLGIIDKETMKKLTKLKFFIIGLRGLGIEILKNLILEGPNTVDIYDPNLITINDLNSNFLINEKDINKERDEVIIERIKELNPNVESKIVKQNISKEDKTYENELLFILSKVNDYDMIIITEFIDKKTLIKINNECRKLDKALIYTCALGLAGFLFNDFGKKHNITSTFYDDDNYYPIKNIKKGEKTLIQLEHSLEGYPDIGEDDYIKLSNIKGMEELNQDILYEVKKKSINEFEICINSTNFNDYTYGGFLQIINIPKKVEFNTFEENLLNPMENKERELIDFPYIGRNDIVHSIIIAMNDKIIKNNDIGKNKRSYIIDEDLLPELNNKEKSDELTELAKIIYNNSKNNKEKWIQIEDIYDENSAPKEFDEEMSKNLCLYLKAELPPIVSFLGGVASQEIVKLTGKFTPFNQWFEFEFNYLSNKYNNININKNEEVEQSFEKTRYNEQIQIFGPDVQDKLNSLNIFLIGAGAIGCEYMKNFAMMGISCNNNNKLVKNGCLTVTDFDKIELSNLNRQFLFRENNINQFKSEVAKNLVKQMNNSINIISSINLVGPETENIFDDEFWDKQDIIFNAVDNVKARMYINDKVTFYQKYHVDAGTLGVNSSSGFFLKNLSSTYKEQNENKKEDEDSNGEIGMCTIHSFPTSIKHCIEWACNEYKYIFSEFINELNQIIQGNYLFLYKILIKKIFPFYKNLKIEEINSYFDILITKSYSKAIQYSFIKFKNKFNLEIKEILKEHPENSKDEKGNNFYSGSKHIPIIIDFNINNEIDNLIICYVKSYANLLFDSLGLMKSDEELRYNNNDIKQICLKTEFGNYDNINKKSMISKIKYDKEFCQNYINQLQNTILSKMKLQSIEQINLKEIIFAKDSISNSQFDFIYACTNLKAINFQIPQCDYIKTKNLSSKIVPSIVTSNAVITGLVSMQLYLLSRLIIEKEKKNNDLLEKENALSLFRNYYINLGINSYCYSNLPKKIIHNAIYDIPSGWSEWDSILFYGPLMIKDFINNIEQKYNVKLLSIFIGKAMIYDVSAQEKNDVIIIEELYQNITKVPINSKQKYLLLYVNAKTADGNKANLPKIKYIIDKKNK
jgi:ubiquitin-activating enzyme E1